MQRRRDIDILKGLCMVTIVLAHTQIVFLWFSYIFIYGFYFSAGYTFKDKPFWEFSKQKIRSLYIPFVIDCLLGLCVVALLSRITDNYYYFDKDLFSKKILLLNMPHTLFAPAWFIFPLFIIYFLFYLLNKVFNEYIILGISFFIYIFTYCTTDIFVKYFWNNCAWVINVFYGLFVFSCGYILKNNQRIEKILIGKFSMDIYCISFIACYSLYYFFPYDLDMRQGICGNILANTLMIICGITNLLSASKMIDKTKWVGNILSTVGKHSRAVMFFHILGFSVVTLSVHKIYNCPYPESWNYAYDGTWRILNAACGLCIPVMCSRCYRILKGKMPKSMIKRM